MLKIPAACDADPAIGRAFNDTSLEPSSPAGLSARNPPVASSPITPADASSVTRALTKALTSSIVNAYERHLKFTPEGCRWKTEGRTAFSKTVGAFVAEGKPVEFVLPAFPCKSSNLNKVSGALPDKGEELALRTLKLFSDDVTSFYSPGVLVRIVSDGHVFSDLVGTDDAAVDDYNAALKEMASGIDARVLFAGLDELLNHIPDAPEGCLPPTGPMATVHTPEADSARASLLEMFGQPPATIDERLSKDKALTGLCRGFSKFVFEDTLQHPSLRSMSQSKRKRVAWSTAKLMILRNEAYSRLVEVCFPSAVRLSIHPHNNAGPKFPISLVHPSFRCGLGAPAESKLFHIPTPWHNVALQLPGGGFVLLKRYMLRNLETTEHQVRYVEPTTKAEGAYFRLVV